MNTIQKYLLAKLNKVAEQVKEVDEDKLEAQGYDLFSSISELDWFSQKLKIDKEIESDKEEK